MLTDKAAYKMYTGLRRCRDERVTYLAFRYFNKENEIVDVDHIITNTRRTTLLYAKPNVNYLISESGRCSRGPFVYGNAFGMRDKSPSFGIYCGIRTAVNGLFSQPKLYAVFRYIYIYIHLREQYDGNSFNGRTAAGLLDTCPRARHCYTRPLLQQSAYNVRYVCVGVRVYSE